MTRTVSTTSPSTTWSSPATSSTATRTRLELHYHQYCHYVHHRHHQHSQQERKPSKIDIPFVVSIETPSDRNCAGCRTCCLDYNCWLKTQDVLYTIVNDTCFDVLVTLCIILNTVFLAIEHHGMSKELAHVLDLGNKVFTTFFALEAVLKLGALSREYFGNGWNIFDLVIVVASLLDLCLERVDGISVFRGMRLVSIFIEKAENGEGNNPRNIFQS